MSSSRHIAFLTGTRADFGKIKPLIIAAHEEGCRVSVFATGMHMLPHFGSTVLEVKRTIPTDIPIIPFLNQRDGDTMDIVVANTITGLSQFITEHAPDALVVHGDRPEALAGAIAGTLRNTRVIHVEGGELSGTIDGVIRHAVSKLSHIHLVANESARDRLIQLGEHSDTIHVIGSPDLDVMLSPTLPSLDEAKLRYEIMFDKYLIAIFHPVTTDLAASAQAAEQFVSALIASKDNFIVIHPNNDSGFEEILSQYKRLEAFPNRFRVFESLRFEHFLTLLKNARAIIGNSSAGIREAPLYGVPSIDIGDRQRGRHEGPTILPTAASETTILTSIKEISTIKCAPELNLFGDGQSAERFKGLISTDVLFTAPVDKVFVDLKDVM
ncbi:MAG: UDP-N-acetylglucosamine 2-epimerase (hydrolyzing) [Actinobacteria bacterium]|nr:MAG: UDP-N-acetylglucosamine 2-epimerase (hydrolyzing) [Actinomycetota bacterium]